MEHEELLIHITTHGKGTEECPYYTSYDYYILERIRTHRNDALLLEDHSRAEKPFIRVNGALYFTVGERI